MPFFFILFGKQSYLRPLPTLLRSTLGIPMDRGGLRAGSPGICPPLLHFNRVLLPLLLGLWFYECFVGEGATEVSPWKLFLGIF